MEDGRAGYVFVRTAGQCQNKSGFIDWGYKWKRSSQLRAYCVGPRHPAYLDNHNPRAYESGTTSYTLVQLR